jgi:hypothetical protein
MSKPHVLLQKRLAFREEWVDLGDGKRVRFRRPLMAGTLALQRKPALDSVVENVVDWEGFTEADVLPSGGEDAVPYDADLFRDVVADRLDWILKIDRAIGDAITAYATKLKDSLGNSPST